MFFKEVWFSHRENIYKVKNGKFYWTDKKQIWDWDYCTIGLTRTLKNKLRVVVRSKTNENSRFMRNRPIELRFMLGFDISKVSNLKTESYIARKNHPDSKKREGPKNRWVFQLNNNYWIWEWAKEEGDISSSNIYRLYQLISDEILNPSIKSDNIFEAELEKQSDMLIPVIYQPAVDALDKFCKRNSLRPV